VLLVSGLCLLENCAASPIFNISSLNSFLSKLLCSQCLNPCVEIQPNSKYNSGLYIKYVAMCNDCGHEIEFWHVKKQASPVNSSSDFKA